MSAIEVVYGGRPEGRYFIVSRRPLWAGLLESVTDWVCADMGPLLSSGQGCLAAMRSIVAAHDGFSGPVRTGEEAVAVDARSG